MKSGKGDGNEDGNDNGNDDEIGNSNDKSDATGNGGDDRNSKDDERVTKMVMETAMALALVMDMGMIVTGAMARTETT